MHSVCLFVFIISKCAAWTTKSYTRVPKLLMTKSNDVPFYDNNFLKKAAIATATAVQLFAVAPANLAFADAIPQPGQRYLSIFFFINAF